MKYTTDISGNYFIEGSKLISGDTILLTRDRKKQTDKKPVKFLLVNLGSGYEYVSSLYQTGNNVFTFDTLNDMQKYDLEKSVYQLTIKNEQAIIKKLEKQT